MSLHGLEKTCDFEKKVESADSTFFEFNVLYPRRLEGRTDDLLCFGEDAVQVDERGILCAFGTSVGRAYRRFRRARAARLAVVVAFDAARGWYGGRWYNVGWRSGLWYL